jgi:GTP-binding protein YchF
VKGASEGEGLGNQFLSHIREVDVILQVIRCFDDSDIVHVAGNVDPIRDLQTIETELLLADLSSLEKIIDNLSKKAKNKDSILMIQLDTAKKIYDEISNGIFAKDVALTPEELNIIKQFCLITMKQIVYIANVDEGSVLNGNKYSQVLDQYLKDKKLNPAIIISSKIEAEISCLEKSDQQDFLISLGLKESGLAKIVNTGYKMLNLITFFTVGPKECHAWSLKKNATAPEAAGTIHTDFQEGFIKAQTISYNDYITYKGEDGAKNAGKMRTEGKEYIVQDGDIFHFMFNKTI